MMNFYGLQKMTLLDFPGKVACTLFTGGCNFRCPFCHNASLVTELDGDTVLPEEAILSFLDTRKGLLDGVCVTGGEPLLYPELPEFLEKVRALGFAVKLDTNGSFPDRLRNILSRGLVDYVAMDIKNTFDKYPQTVGVPDFDPAPIKESIALLRDSGTDYEFRTTVVAQFHTPEDIETIAETLSFAGHYFLQNFEDSGNLIGDGLSAVSPETLSVMRERAARFIPSVSVRGI